MFVGDLFSAYLAYAKRHGFSAELLDTANGKVVAKITGKGVWTAFQHESGKHCVQRCPPTERSGRKQTSMVSVAVLPLPDESKIKSLPANEVELSFSMGQGPGGQHKQRTMSRARAVHKPTGLVVTIDGRDQHHNRRMALRILAARVNEREQEKRAASYGANRKAQWGGGGRGDKVRTYNFLESRAVDHRLGTKTSQVKEVMKGRFELLTEGK